MNGDLPMRVAVGVDHAGYRLKNVVVQLLKSKHIEVIDLGTDSEVSVDYPDFAKAVAETIRKGDADRGIVICGSGVGACVVANKLPGIRAGTCHDTYSAHQGVEHDDMNVLCLGARIIGQELAIEIVNTFLMAQFTGEERHKRRLAKIAEIEHSRIDPV
jgi:ribose 5-phosphate isomerase B